MSTDSDTVDPRVQVELERLNTATDDINTLEVDLDEARTAFRKLLVESAEKVRAMANKLGASVQSAKPYYEARIKASQALHQTKSAVIAYDKAHSAHCAAREMVYLAEQGLGGAGVGITLDPAWQEMLNHATSRVNQAESERGLAKSNLLTAQSEQDRCSKDVMKLQQELKNAIKASSLSIRRNLLLINVAAFKHQVMCLPYYECRAQYSTLLQTQRNRMQLLEQQVSSAKISYSQALKNLEQISDEIHCRRKNKIKLTPQQNGSYNPDSTGDTDSKISDFSDVYDCDFLDDEFLSIPENLGKNSAPISPTSITNDSPHLCKNVEGAKNIKTDIKSKPPEGSSSDEFGKPIVTDDETWTEINLTKSSPEELDIDKISSLDNYNADIPYERFGDCTWTMSDSSDSTDNFENISNNSISPTGAVKTVPEGKKCPSTGVKKRLIPQMSLPESQNAPTPRKQRERLASWVTRSSAAGLDTKQSPGRRQSLDVLLGDTGDKVKEMLSQGIQIIGSLKLSERRGSDLSTNLQDLNCVTDSSNDMASSDMMTDEQIKNLMLEEDFSSVCSQFLSPDK